VVEAAVVVDAEDAAGIVAAAVAEVVDAVEIVAAAATAGRNSKKTT
jgi:hypothetical protein